MAEKDNRNNEKNSDITGNLIRGLRRLQQHNPHPYGNDIPRGIETFYIWQEAGENFRNGFRRTLKGIITFAGKISSRMRKQR